ncbi:uncharacterized protein GGS25DRAFT_518826 [Hypoxylon fragiforme]|uniref:uncharacterized protein n=1 Tax=Hypoxylon fragiforme TaxID=63214 RepID=UPI0020C6B48B|nr:uncharacterized protein GGS25DRAFT_518826 [Hypoxylon fragiforme]KAI2613144.1 hypothetical protein GGS25DRAFT_518826 [Hypoxylon fragiforme]
MCWTVRFIYACGCVERTTFECPENINYRGSALRRRRRRCSRYLGNQGTGALKEVSDTWLNEDCYDCALAYEDEFYEETIYEDSSEIYSDDTATDFSPPGSAINTSDITALGERRSSRENQSRRVEVEVGGEMEGF